MKKHKLLLLPLVFTGLLSTQVLSQGEEAVVEEVKQARAAQVDTESAVTAKLNKQLEEIASKIGSFKLALDEVEEQTGSNTSSLAEQASGLESLATELDLKLGLIDQVFESITADISSINNATQDINSRTEANSQAIEQLTAATKTTSQELEKLGTQLNASQQDIAANKQTLEGVQADLDSKLQAATKEIETRVTNNLNQATQEFDQKLAAQNTSYRFMQSKVHLLENKINSTVSVWLSGFALLLSVLAVLLAFRSGDKKQPAASSQAAAKVAEKAEAKKEAAENKSENKDKPAKA